MLEILYSPGTYVSGCKFQFGKTSGSEITALCAVAPSPTALNLVKLERNWLGASDVDLARRKTKAKKEKGDASTKTKSVKQ